MEKQDVKDVLLALLRESYSRLNHYEVQRSTVSNLLVIIAAAILAFVTFDKALTLADLPLTLLLFVIGLFGAAFCAKYYERATRYSDQIRLIRDKLDAVLFDSGLLNDIRNRATEKHAVDFPSFHKGHLSRWKIYRLWITFHLFIALLGFILTILIYFV